ncbi:MAG: bile acid:sodium symporter family protein [Bacteroidales bacterium]|nr:bile acid:sodium symporter family protein [Bacteroidales bacterium]
MKQICRFIAKHMGVLVLLAAVLALLWPAAFSVLKPSMISYLLGVVMFGMGLTLNARDLKIVFARPKDILLGCAAQFTVMPLLAWGLTKIFALDEALALGVILVGCCPGGTSSNVITYLSRGDLPLSVGMTAVSTLLAPVMTPLLVLLLAGKSIEVNVAGMFLSILWVVILPIALGLLVKKIWPDVSAWAADYLPALSSLAIATIVLTVVSANAANLLAGGMVILAVVMLHNVCGYAMGYGLGFLLKLPAAKKKALSIEVGMQNSGLASSLAATHFAAFPMAAIPGAIFSVWHNISGALLARIFSRNDN